MRLKLVASMKILNSRQYPHQEGTVTEKSYGSIHHIMKTNIGSHSRENQHHKRIAVVENQNEYSYDSLKSACFCLKRYNFKIQYLIRFVCDCAVVVNLRCKIQIYRIFAVWI